MAVFRIITFLIHAIVQAFASLLVAVFTHVVPAILAVVALLAIVFAVCASCGIGGLTFLRRRKAERDEP
jgi:hypothetical protein